MRALVEYPLEDVSEAQRCAYMNNTTAYALAFALWNRVGQIDLFGMHFSYKHNLHFAEAGRACVEFWLSKCISAGIVVSVARRSGLLDTDLPIQEKIYGYHRLDNPPVILFDPDTGDFYKTGHKEYVHSIEEENRKNAKVIPILDTQPEAKRY